VPNVVGDNEATAVWRLRDVGLTVHIERPYDDRSCERVDDVFSQGPSAGRIVRPGSLVVIEVPTEPPAGCY
jgi:beta-lactam-binding protein with PASTA domain